MTAIKENRGEYKIRPYILHIKKSLVLAQYQFLVAP